MQFFLGYDSGFEQKKYIKNFISSFRTQNALEKQKQIFFFSFDYYYLTTKLTLVEGPLNFQEAAWLTCNALGGRKLFLLQKRN